MSRTAENIIVFILAVAIVAGLLYFIGYDNIKDWLSTPFIWKDPEFLDIKYLGTLEEERRNDKKILFRVHNTSEYCIDYYCFQVVSDAEVLEFGAQVSAIMSNGFERSSGDIEANAFTTLSYNGSFYPLEYAYEYLSNLDSRDIEKLQCRVVLLQSGSETLVNNNGWVKTITILAISLLAGILVINEVVKVTWIRLILKLLCIPAIIILVFGVVFLAGGDRKSSESARARSRDNQYRYAKQRYDRAANLKAGATITGRPGDAARAQAEMDKAMADMITAKGSGSSAKRVAAAKYKREANLKAGATITGRPGDAARAQAEMDKAMADMIKGE